MTSSFGSAAISSREAPALPLVASARIPGATARVAAARSAALPT